MSYSKNTNATPNKPIRIISQEQINRFGERLKEAMNGMSNNAFAKQCGWSEKVIRNYLNGESYPSLDRLAVIANVSGRSIGWLASGEIDESSDNVTNKETQSSQATPEQHQVWREILERMTPEEREHILDNVFRQGIGVLLNKGNHSSSFIIRESSDDLSADDLLVARMYSTLTPEQRKSFLESFITDERNQANRDISDKTKAS